MLGGHGQHMSASEGQLQCISPNKNGEEFGGSSRNNSFVSVLVLVDLQTSAEREIRYCQHQYHLKHSFEVWMHFKW